MKNIGIKFCGGCRAAYDRRGASERISKAMQDRSEDDLHFEWAQEGKTYDDMIVMCGCTNRCANVKPYDVHGELFYAWGEDSAKDLEQNIK